MKLGRWCTQPVILLWITALTPPVQAQNVEATSTAQKPKTLLFSLPLQTYGREGVLRAETNLALQAGCALEWTEWGQRELRQELTPKTLQANPGHSMLSKGQDLGIMLSRYSNPAHLSGFHWGLGAGYRNSQMVWVKNTRSPHTDPVDSDPLVHYALKAHGTTLSGRLGYRYVGSDIGFSIGAYLGIKHFQAQLMDRTGAGDRFTPLAYQDGLSLKRRLMTQPRLGIEAGWAF